MKRGKDYIFLILISIFCIILFFNFVNADYCSGSDFTCIYLDSEYMCNVYGTYCSWDGSNCEAKGAPSEITCGDIKEKDLCTSDVNCIWIFTAPPRCVDTDRGDAPYNTVVDINIGGGVTVDGNVKGWDGCGKDLPINGQCGVYEQYCMTKDAWGGGAWMSCGLGRGCTCGTTGCYCYTPSNIPAANTFCGQKIFSIDCGSNSGSVSYTLTGTLPCVAPNTCINNVCVTPVVTCGDGTKEGTEGCDDGNKVPGDGCSATCTVESGWTCVTTTGTSQNPDTICTPICGNGVVQTSEGCDDGNTAPYDGCGPTCQVEAGYTCVGTPSVCQKCGNGMKEGTEGCDDGNNVPGDGCSATCTVESGWTCVGTAPSVCTRLCGNGIINLGEGCDDGNTAPYDGCGPTCQVESGWTCIGVPSVCTKICTPTKTSCSSSDCGSVPNGCGVYLDCGGCDISGQQCISNTCQCVTTSNVACYNDDLYRVDSCGNTITTSKVEECDKGNSCYDYYCSGGSCRADYICGCNGDNSKCADSDLCTIDTCASDGTCDYTYRTCGVDGDGCCRSGCTYPNDQDCPPPVATCGDGSINQAWEECDCGTDGICSSSELGGETCSSWDSKYIGGTLGCSSCQIITTMCTEPCKLEDAYWSTSSTYVGSSVNLIVTGSSSCTGKLITFEVWKDGTLSDTRVTTLSSKTMSSGNVINTWTPTETSPNNGYYFIAKISDGSDSIKSDALEVLENVGCGDETCGSGENCNNCPDDCKSCCGNGMCDSNECVTCPGDCSNCEIPCGNGKCETVLGENCNTCAADCPLCPPQNCGNGNIDSGEVCDGANLGGETCISQGYGGGSLVCAWNCQSFDVGGCTGEPPKECEINSPTWNVTTALEGTPVRLNFNAVNCNGETISFFVLEKDGGLLNRDEPAKINPASFVYGPSNTYGTWYAEGQDDDDETGGESYPPEYYFRVIVNDEKKAESSNSGVNDPLLLKVQSPDVTCAGINYCADYDNQEDCENDAALCNVGEASVFGVSCGSIYNDATQCWDKVTCGCSWDNNEGVCKGEWEEESECGGNNVCVPYENECWLAGDLCTDECTCFGTSTPNGEGSCDYSGSGVCSEEDQCWLAGDHCEDDCTCEDGYPSNNDGTCGNYNPNVCVEDYNENECWLSGDLCTDECTCFGTSTPNGEGSCDYSGSGVCSEEDQCWLAGDHCEDDCTCEDGYETNNNGICVDENGGSGGIIRKKGTCLYTETGGDTCEDNYLDRVLDAVWQWDPTNSYTEIPAGENEADYVQDVENGVYRYDPQRKSQLCIDIQDRFVCPASVEVPFFGMYQLITALTIVGLIYLIFILRKKE